MVVPKFTAIAKKIRPTTRQQTTTVMNKNTRGRGRKRKKQGKDEDDEEEEEGKETVSESESSPRGKAKGADGEEEEQQQQQQQRGGGGEEKKTPRKEDEGGMTTLAANAEQTKDAIDIQLKPNMDPRLKGEIENAFETVTKLIHRMDAHNAQTLEHLDMVRKATEERNRAAKDKLLDIMTESFRKLADKANESAMLEEKIEAMKDMIANLRQSIGA
ncbi:unnamed protein product [Bathycoccus prasinos]